MYDTVSCKAFSHVSIFDKTCDIIFFKFDWADGYREILRKNWRAVRIDIFEERYRFSPLFPATYCGALVVVTITGRNEYEYYLAQFKTPIDNLMSHIYRCDKFMDRIVKRIAVERLIYTMLHPSLQSLLSSNYINLTTCVYINSIANKIAFIRMHRVRVKHACTSLNKFPSNISSKSTKPCWHAARLRRLWRDISSKTCCTRTWIIWRLIIYRARNNISSTINEFGHIVLANQSYVSRESIRKLRTFRIYSRRNLANDYISIRWISNARIFEDFRFFTIHV